MSSKKIFVLDTNVLLYDFMSIFNFEDNDVVLPIVVLEELDNFKKGNDIINLNAREFTRRLDALIEDGISKKGISLGEGMGKLFIDTSKEYPSIIADVFSDKTPDHRILGTTVLVKERNPKKEVVLVTKDINLRVKAKSLELLAEDYETGKITDLDILNEKPLTITITKDDLDLFYETGKIDCRIVPLLKDSSELDQSELVANKTIIVKGINKGSALGIYDIATNSIVRIDKFKKYGIEPKNSEQTFLINTLFNKDIKLVAITGKAGTGKTLLSLLSAVSQTDLYDQILLARPIVSLSNKDLGFLPGDINDKIGPYMQPLFDNLGFIKSKSTKNNENKKIVDLEKSDKLIITPLAYIRGRSLSNSFFIIDEAQNLTPHEIKTIITRAGEGTKIVFTGDIFQIDTPYLDAGSNGLSFLIDKMKGQSIFSHINLVKGERSELAELASNLL